MEQIDWTPGYFTWLFKKVLDQHALLWVVYHLRKSFTPWITLDTLEIRKKKDETKPRASYLSKQAKIVQKNWLDLRS